MKNVTLFIVLVLILLCNKHVAAHPHVSVETGITVHFDSEGIGYLDITFTFDEIFSYDFLENFDTDHNNIFSAEEIKFVEQNAFINLLNYNYFIHVIDNNEEIQFKNYTNFSVHTKGDVAVYTFTLQPGIKIGSTPKTIKIAPYDHSYYIDVYLDKENLSFENTDGYSFNYDIIRDKKQAYYYGQIFPDCVVLNVNAKE